MRRDSRLTWLGRALFTLGLACLAPGCAGAPPPAAGPAAAPPPALGWPPAAGSAHAVSSTEIAINGSEYSAAGGGSSPAGQVLHLDGSGGLAWAIYTFDGLNDLKYPTHVSVHAVGFHTVPGGPTQLYVGVSHHYRGHWIWQRDSAQQFECSLTQAGQLVSHGGRSSIALALCGPGTTDVYEVRVTFSIYPPPPPANLTAVADIGEVSLDWDDEPEAAGFNLYRCTGAALSDPLKLNSGLLTESAFSDQTAAQGVIYCYYVTSVGDGESSRGNVADVFTPATDLPAPQNPVVLERSADSVTLGWEWPGNDPAAFTVLVGSVPDFGLGEVVRTISGIAGGLRSTVVESLEPGMNYAWRVVARDPVGRLGRMSDDVPVALEGYWIWNERLVGAGSFPAALATDGQEIAVAYLNEDAVIFATADPDSGIFTSTPTPLDATIDGAGFADYLDMAWGGSEFLVAAQSKASQDLYAMTGTPVAGWATHHIHGDGATGAGRGRSGYGIRAAREGALCAVLHQDRSLDQLLLHTFSAGDSSWSTAVVAADSDVPSSHSLALDPAGAHIIWFSATQGQLNYFWNGDGFSPHPAGTMGRYNDLALVGGALMTPVYANTTDLYVLRDDAGSWNGSLVDDQSVPVGLGAQLVPDGSSRAFMVYRDDDASVDWYLGVYDGAFWSLSRIAIPGVSFDAVMRLACLNGVPFILYSIPTQPDNLYSARGTPPAP